MLKNLSKIPKALEKFWPKRNGLWSPWNVLLRKNSFRMVASLGFGRVCSDPWLLVRCSLIEIWEWFLLIVILVQSRPLPERYNQSIYVYTTSTTQSKKGQLFICRLPQTLSNQKWVPLPFACLSLCSAQYMPSLPNHKLLYTLLSSVLCSLTDTSFNVE